jgi:hypothetical protein
MYLVLAPGQSNVLPLTTKESTSDEVKQTVLSIQEKSSNVVDNMREELNAEHDRLLEELQKAFPLADNQWQKMHEQLNAIIAQDNLLLQNKKISKKSDQPLVAIAQEVLETTDINPSRVNIEVVEKPKSACDASAGQCYRNGKVEHFLQLNSSRLQERELPVQQALLKHECVHLINYDGLRQVFIESLLKRNGIEEQIYRKHPAFCAYLKHIELRADLFASGYDTDFAQGLLEGIQEHMEKYPNPPVSLNHPTDQQRYTAIANLKKHMEAEEKLTLA